MYLGAGIEIIFKTLLGKAVNDDKIKCSAKSKSRISF